MTTLRILSPADLVPGAVSPEGRTVARAVIFNGPGMVIASIAYTDGTTGSLTWPRSDGWASPANHPSVTHPAPKETP